MSGFGPAETAACCRLIELALHEDLADRPSWAAWNGDATSWLLIPPGYRGKAVVTVRTRGVLAGLPCVALVAGAVDPELAAETLVEDGASVRPGDRIAVLTGSAHAIFAAERTALNFLQRLSGIATLTRQYVEAVAGLRSRILDTRKTTPGWRLIEKYAVRCGGGNNHRLGLYDGILIKDNHLAATKKMIPIAAAIRKARMENGSLRLKMVEIEVDTLQQFEQALPAKPDMILLDNMALDDMREAVHRRDAVAPDVLLEASGGVTLETVRAIAETGVDRISVGALTHSAPALDIGLDYQASDG